MGTTGSTEIEMLAYREAMSLDVPALVNGLNDLLGARLVADIGSVRRPRRAPMGIPRTSTVPSGDQTTT